MATALPNAVNTSATSRFKKRRDLETTMNTLKKLLEPAFATTKKGSRKKNKPRSLAKKAQPPKKTNRFENCSEDGEYYPNKLKRKVRMNKTILKPRHELKVVVATNKRKRGTPHKGLESIDEEPYYKFNTPPPNIDVNTTPDNSSVLTTDSNVNTTGSNVYTLPVSNTATSNDNVYTPGSNVNTNGSNVNKTHGSNVNTEPSSYNTNTEELKVYTPPPSSNPDIFELTSPPHRSLTQMTVDDLIRMDEDSLSDEDLMEILTCPSPVWWEEPIDKCKGMLYLTTASEIQEPSEITNSKKHTELKTYSNKKAIGVKRTGTVNVSVNKAKKITKLENILGRIKSLVRTDDKHVNSIPQSVKNNYNTAEEVIDKNNGDAITVIEIGIDETDNISKRRTMSSSGSEISVNEEDLLRNLESIDIPIQKLNNDDASYLKNDLDINKKTIAVENDNVIPVDENDRISDSVVKESPGNKRAVKGSLVKKNNYEIPPVPKIKNKSNRKGAANKINVSNKSLLDSNKTASKPNKSILKKLKPNDDILDVRLIKIPTNVTNEVKIWSKLDNFKKHNFKPSDFENDVIDIEDELEFSMIEVIPSKVRDPLGTRNDTILIDDESDDALDVNKSRFNDTINLDVDEQCNLVTITAVENDDSSQNSEINDIDPKVVDYNDIIQEDTIRIGNDLDVRLIETSDVKLIKPKRKRKKATTKRNNKNKSTEILGVSYMKTLPKETIANLDLSLYDTTKEPKEKWHISNYLQYGEKSNDRGIFRVLDTEDSSDTILRLNDHVDVSLVKNVGPKKDAEISVEINENTKNNDLSITLINNTSVKDLTITPMVLPTLTKNPKTTFESPKSVLSLTSEGTVEYSEGTISDTNIQFLDEYVDKSNEGDRLEIQSKPEEHEIKSLTKDSDTENIAADIDGDIESRQNLDKSEINIDKTEDLESVNEEEPLKKIQDSSDNKQTNLDEHLNECTGS